MGQNDYGLNDEQWKAVNAPSPTICNASAGAGKTRCLVAKIGLILDSGASPESICAVTFTNKAAAEMKERLKTRHNISGMQISTIHSMCVRIIRQFPKHTPLKVPFSIYDDNDQQTVVKTILKARKMDDSPWDALSAISRAKADGDMDRLDPDMQRVYRAYQDILIANNACDFDDLLIYAARCLKQPDCRGYFSTLWKHLLVDEFQDTSTVQYEIILSLYDVNRTRSMYCTGDLNQCVIEGTMIGDTKAEDISFIDFIPAARGAGRLDNFSVADIFKKQVVDKPVTTIKTTSGKELTITDEHVIFAGYICRKDYDPLYFTYLMFKEGLGYRVGVTQIKRGAGRKTNEILGFKMRLNQEHADCMWLLGAYSTKAEAKYYETLYSIKYCIPTWVFYTREGMDYDDTYIQRLFKEVDTEAGARKLLKDLRLFFTKPHHVPKCMNIKRRRNFNITLCANDRNLIRHRYSLSGSDPEDENILKKHGFNARFAKNNKSRGYRVEGAVSQLGDAYEICDNISKIMELNIIENAHLTSTSLPMIPAAHALKGMSCFVVDPKTWRVVEDQIVSVTKSHYTGNVYDFNVNHVHNYAANGIIVHNSIYAFRAARPENMQDFITKFKPTICNLTYNYRSASAVIGHANKFLQFGPQMVAKAANTGTVGVSVFSNMEDEARLIAEAIEKLGNYPETAILYRTNARSALFERALAVKRIPYKVVGDLPFYKRRVVKDILSYCKAAANVSDMESLVRIVNNPKRGFGETKQERLLKEGRGYFDQAASELHEIGKLKNTLDKVRGMVPAEAIGTILAETGYRATIEKEYDASLIETLINVASGFTNLDELILSSTFLEEDSGKGVKLMSAHASKGLEFDRVFVVGVEDGVWPHKLSTDILEEERLYYVACTRARKFLNISYSKSKLMRGAPIPCFPSNLFSRSYEATKAITH